MPSTKLVGIVTARQLRKEQTPEEIILWSFLRSRKLNGLKIKRQLPVFYEDEFGKDCFFVADFYCLSKKVIIELDGGIHLKQKDEDAKRTSILEGLGNLVIRFKNEELEEIGKVLKKIADVCEGRGNR